jgi:K+-sensing histidine kinase KdpD
VLSFFRDIGIAFAACALTTLVSLPFSDSLGLANIALFYTLATVVTAAVAGRRSAIVGALLNALAFAYFFVPPSFSLFITELRYILTARETSPCKWNGSRSKRLSVRRSKSCAASSRNTRST